MRRGTGTGRPLESEISVRESENGNGNASGRGSERGKEIGKEIGRGTRETERGKGSETTRSSNASASAISIIFSSNKWHSRDTGTLHTNINTFIPSLQANRTTTSPDRTTTIAHTIIMSFITTTELANLKVALVDTLRLRFLREAPDLFAVPAALANSTLQAARTLTHTHTHIHTHIHILSHMQDTTNSRPK